MVFGVRQQGTEREEEDVYDRLATSVTGDLLSDIYLQNRKSLVVTQAGGARARLQEVEILDVDVRHPDGRSLDLLFHARWTAMGTVGHWGHIHCARTSTRQTSTWNPWMVSGRSQISSCSRKSASILMGRLRPEKEE